MTNFETCHVQSTNRTRCNILKFTKLMFYTSINISTVQFSFATIVSSPYLIKIVLAII